MMTDVRKGKVANLPLLHTKYHAGMLLVDKTSSKFADVFRPLGQLT